MEPGRGGGRAPSPCAEDAAGERRPGWQECALGPARRRGGGGDSRACRDQRLRPVYPKVIAASVLPLPGGGAASSLKQSCFLQGAEVKQEARGPPALLCEALAHLENRPSGGGAGEFIIVQADSQTSSDQAFNPRPGRDGRAPRALFRVFQTQRPPATRDSQDVPTGGSLESFVAFTLF